MNKISVLAASIIALTISGASAQNQYMKAALSSDPTAKSVPAKSTKTPATTTKCQSTGENAC
jgi:hypothetical protein